MCHVFRRIESHPYDIVDKRESRGLALHIKQDRLVVLSSQYFENNAAIDLSVILVFWLSRHFFASEIPPKNFGQVCSGMINPVIAVIIRAAVSHV